MILRNEEEREEKRREEMRECERNAPK